MRKVQEKILRVCFLTSLGDFGPQSSLIFPNSQFFIKQHIKVKRDYFSHSNLFFFLLQWDNGTGMARRYWKIPTASWEVGNTSRCPEAKPREEGGISKPRRMRWVFSNPTEPWLCHCHCNSEKNKYCQEVYIDQCKPLDNSKILLLLGGLHWSL